MQNQINSNSKYASMNGKGARLYPRSHFPVKQCSKSHNFREIEWDVATLLKHPGQRDPEKGPLGPNSIPGHYDPEIGQLIADLTNNGVRLTQLWVTFRVKLTDFRVIVDPEWSLAPMDPFRVNF